MSSDTSDAVGCMGPGASIASADDLSFELGALLDLRSSGTERYSNGSDCDDGGKEREDVSGAFRGCVGVMVAVADFLSGCVLPNADGGSSGAALDEAGRDDESSFGLFVCMDCFCCCL